MTIKSEIQSLSPSALIELFQLDLTIQSGSTLYFHAGTNELMSDVIWNGQIYSHFPIAASGFKKSATGALPRPTLTVSNINGYMGALARQYNGFRSCKLIRIRTFARYLDAINFEAGNASADPSQALPDEIWYVDRKSAENGSLMSFELSSALDLVGVKIPARQFIQNTCTWIYRGADCGYTGGAVADANGNPTSDLSKDNCGKCLSDCKLRFGANAILPYGGFPGSGLN
jgi:lambda family phage minor tail protein L